MLNRLTTVALGAMLCSGLVSVTPRAACAQLTTIVTDHFRIHYTKSTAGTARRIAETAEEVFAPLATAYDYYDDFSPIHVIVVDNSDALGNGSANYYSNTITIWATNLDSDLRGSHDWIRNVMTHELTHIITLNKARKKWPVQFGHLSLTRSASNPDVNLELPLYHLTAPAWWSEGIAQYATHQFGYETWDSHRDMLLRMAVLEDDLHSYTEMGGLQFRSGGYYGEQVYNQGYGLLLYVDEVYGRDEVEALTHETGALSFDRAVDKVLGISAGQLYDDWVAYLEERYGGQATRIAPSQFEGNELEELNQGIIEYYPTFSPDGGKLAFVTSEDQDFPIPKLVIHDFATGETKRLDGFTDTRISWSPDGGELAYVRNKSGFNDLFIYDVEADEERRISARLRAKDPDFSPDGERLVFVHNEDGTNNLGMIDRGGTNLAYLTNHNDGTQYAGPRWSSDGEWILFSIFQGDDRDIAMMRADSPPRLGQREKRERKLEGIPDSLQVFPDSLAFPHPDTSGFRPVLASSADERDPYWLPDGSGFVFASDRSGIFNIYEYEMATGEVQQLTTSSAEPLHRLLILRVVSPTRGITRRITASTNSTGETTGRRRNSRRQRRAIISLSLTLGACRTTTTLSVTAAARCSMWCPCSASAPRRSAMPSVSTSSLAASRLRLEKYLGVSGSAPLPRRERISAPARISTRISRCSIARALDPWWATTARSIPPSPSPSAAGRSTTSSRPGRRRETPPLWGRWSRSLTLPTCCSSRMPTVTRPRS